MNFRKDLHRVDNDSCICFASQAMLINEYITCRSRVKFWMLLQKINYVEK